MELKATTYDVDGHIAVVHLHRPHRHNAWTGRMHTEYRWCLAAAESDPSVRAVVVTGTGDTFCVGADSGALRKEADAGHYDAGVPEDAATPGYGTRPEFDHDLVWHWGLRLPVVMAVNGACAGVGLALACYGDVRVIADTARLSTAAPQLGLPAEFGLSWVLPRLIGLTRATDLLLSGRRFTGVDAERWGLATEVCTADEVLPRAMAHARRFAVEVSPSAVEVTKGQIYADQLHLDVGASVERSRALLDQMMGRPDFAEGVAALQERRAPRFPSPGSTGPATSADTDAGTG